MDGLGFELVELRVEELAGVVAVGGAGPDLQRRSERRDSLAKDSLTRSKNGFSLAS